MATASHHHHAMRPYPLCHLQPPPPPSTSSDGSTGTIKQNHLHHQHSATGAGLTKTIISGGVAGGSVGTRLGTAVPTVPYFYPTTNQVSIIPHNPADRFLFYSSSPCPAILFNVGRALLLIRLFHYTTRHSGWLCFGSWQSIPIPLPHKIRFYE